MPLIPLDSFVFQHDLDTFLKTLQSSVGPLGRLQLIQSSTGQMTLTSASSRLLSTLPISNPVLQLLVQAVQAQLKKFGDGGLYSGILAALLVHYAFDQHEQDMHISQLLRAFGTIIQSTLNDVSSAVCIPVSLDSVLPLVMIVKSILSSKPVAVGQQRANAGSSIDSIAFLLVRGYLATAGSLGQLLVKVHPGCENSQLLDGVLYTCVDDEHILLRSNDWSHVPVLLITVMLTDQLDPQAEKVRGVEVLDAAGQLEAANGLLTTAVQSGIRLIASQRVVHPSLILSLRRQGVIVLPRLGRKLAAAVELLSGAVPISSLTPLSPDDIKSLQGSIKSIDHLKHFDKNYLLMSGGNDSKVMTLSLFTVSPEAACELEVVAHQALKALSYVVADGIVLPGGGCSETFLCSRLWQQVQLSQGQLCRDYKCTKRQLVSVARGLQLALLHAVGLNPVDGSLLVDSVYHHAWNSKEYSLHLNETALCHCGLISVKGVLEAGGDWKTVCSLSSEPLFRILHSDAQIFPLSLPQARLDSSLPHIVLDVLSSKLNAFQLALDVCIGITNIGAIVSKEESEFTHRN